jgi:hypothetical protein
MECSLRHSDYPGFDVLELAQIHWLATKEAVVCCVLLFQGFLHILDSLLLLVLSQRPPTT